MEWIKNYSEMHTTLDKHAFHVQEYLKDMAIMAAMCHVLKLAHVVVTGRKLRGNYRDSNSYNQRQPVAVALK